MSHITERAATYHLVKTRVYAMGAAARVDATPSRWEPRDKYYKSSVYWNAIVPLGPATHSGVHMPHVLIIHDVESYPAWKVVFDRAAERRKRAGEISYQLLRYDTDANAIVHFSAWSSLENARRFFESPELVELRKAAGVKAPNFLYLQEIERGIL